MNDAVKEMREKARSLYQLQELGSEASGHDLHYACIELSHICNHSPALIIALCDGVEALKLCERAVSGDRYRIVRDALTAVEQAIKEQSHDG